MEHIAKAFLPLFFLVASTGCDNDRLAKLEKQNVALSEQLASLQKSNQLELQSKCAKDAKMWFTENWQSDKDTILLTFENHYSERLNKCIITVFYNYNIGGRTSSFQKITSIYDIYENARLAEYSELHMLIANKSEVQMGTCEVRGVRCATGAEFSKRVADFQ